MGVTRLVYKPEYQDGPPTNDPVIDNFRNKISMCNMPLVAQDIQLGLQLSLHDTLPS